MLISLLVTVLFGLIYFYINIPAINIHAPEFYQFVILLCVVFCGVNIFESGFHASDIKDYFKFMIKKATVPFIIAAAMVVISLVGSVVGSEVFRSRSYAKLLTVEQGDFSEEVNEVSWNQIPMLDDVSANTLANKKLGELSDLVSQFEVDSSSVQINYQGSPVRATYLNYGDVIKWWNNHDEGIPAYILIDMATQEVTINRLEEGIKYAPSEYFNHDIDRYLRLKYPTKMFSSVNFEVDEEGNPYWIASVVTKTIGLFGGTDVEGAVLVNAVTGEHAYYDMGDIPTWVDRVCNAGLIIEQYDYYGTFQNGFLNSIFGQSGCTVSTSGYNYIAMDDDVWVYTGVTSVGGDESNLGFILVNQRTKEARYYACAGANENAGMLSAEGAVQQYAYESTFPILLNIGGEPTYFMSLKDSSSLVKMYAMVNVSQYQIVAVGSTVEECQQNYSDLLKKGGIVKEEEAIVDELQVSGVIDDIRSSVIDGNTYYYIHLSNNVPYYMICAKDSEVAAILNVGEEVFITYEAGDGEILKGITLER